MPAGRTVLISANVLLQAMVPHKDSLQRGHRWVLDAVKLLLSGIDAVGLLDRGHGGGGSAGRLKAVAQAALCLCDTAPATGVRTDAGTRFMEWLACHTCRAIVNLTRVLDIAKTKRREAPQRREAQRAFHLKDLRKYLKTMDDKYNKSGTEGVAPRHKAMYDVRKSV